MGNALVHRSPDDSGTWVDAESGIALAHRRLGFLDLSPHGHQPMASADGRYVVAYNGEIYSFAALRDELLAKGHAFRSRSGTEVLLAATTEWGVEDALLRCNGMFVIAEFAWSLPLAMSHRDGMSKVLLKRVLRRYLPDAMVDRGKRGFGAPVTEWLRGDLRGWAGDLLDAACLQQEGYFDATAIAAVWTAFQRGERKWHTHLWNVLMFQAWHAHWRAERGRHADTATH